MLLGNPLTRASGSPIYPASAFTEVRVMVGTAALFAVAAVFALGLGALLRHGAGAVTVVITAIILPYLITVAFPVLPVGAADWVLRVTPAAGFAIQQAIPQYPQVAGQLHAVQRLLPAGAVGRVRRALRIGADHPDPGRRATAPEGRMKDALHAEWTKLRTLASTFWLLLAAAALTVTVSAAAAAAAACPAGGCAEDPARLSLTGVYLGQAVVAVLAVMAVSGEYGTGMIRLTLAAMPRRGTVLAAKAAVLTGLVLVTGTVAVLPSLLAGRLILPGHGFGPAHGYPALSLGDGPVLRAALGSVLYLALIALLSVGAAAALRDAAAAIGVVLGLLYLFPIIGAVVGRPELARHIQQIGPMTAGLAIQATTGLSSLPISPWAGLAVLAAWAAGALLLGGLLLRLRDA